jgi:hypothetical protein
MSGDHGGRDLTVADPSARTEAETAPLADLRHSTVPAPGPARLLTAAGMVRHRRRRVVRDLQSSSP